jgi:undecaprenyl-diphosphatase
MRPVRSLTSRISVALAILALACATGFLLVAACVRRDGEVGFDQPVISLVRGIGLPPETWHAVTELGGLILLPVGAGLVAWLLSRGQVADAAIVAAALIGATLFTDAVKDAVARPRPPDPVLGPAVGYGFPSGHTLNSTATYGLVALYAWRSRMRPTARRIAVVALASIPFLVGMSRIALGVHWPSDVLGGWLAGMAVVFVVAAITGAPRARAPAPPEAARPGP